MAPEYGATMGFFPVDDETLNYLRRTGRTDDEVAARRALHQGTRAVPHRRTRRPPSSPSSLALDLSTVEPSAGGPEAPARPRAAGGHEAVVSNGARGAASTERGFALDDAALARTATCQNNGHSTEITHGAVVIAAITSCTNTSNPSVMLAAGLLAKKAVEQGLKVKPYVKTSLAPGSRVVTDYLDKAGLTDAAAEARLSHGRLRLHHLHRQQRPAARAGGRRRSPKAIWSPRPCSAAIATSKAASIRYVKANYLASPPLVVAYALAGTTDIDLLNEPLGKGNDGQPVLSAKTSGRRARKCSERVRASVTARNVPHAYGNVFDGERRVERDHGASEGDLYEWDDAQHLHSGAAVPGRSHARATPASSRFSDARVLALLGDSVTTDHISPAGSIAKNSPAGKYLMEHGVQPVDFNSYGARRGNDRVMIRGTFANIRIRNVLVPGTEGGVTRHLPDGERLSIYDAAMKYKADGVPLVDAGRRRIRHRQQPRLGRQGNATCWACGP